MRQLRQQLVEPLVADSLDRKVKSTTRPPLNRTKLTQELTNSELGRFAGLLHGLQRIEPNTLRGLFISMLGTIVLVTCRLVRSGHETSVAPRIDTRLGSTNTALDLSEAVSHAALSTVCIYIQRRVHRAGFVGQRSRAQQRTYRAQLEESVTADQRCQFDTSS